MCEAVNVGAYLQEHGFERDDSVVPSHIDDHLTYSHLNGYTLAIDDHGRGWKVHKIVNLSQHFYLRKIDIVP